MCPADGQGCCLNPNCWLPPTRPEVEGVGTNISVWNTVRIDPQGVTVAPEKFSSQGIFLGIDWEWGTDSQWGYPNRSSGYSSSFFQTLHMPRDSQSNPTAPPAQMAPVAPCLLSCCLLPNLHVDGIRLCHCCSCWRWQSEGPRCFHTPPSAAPGNQRAKLTGNSTQQSPWASLGPAASFQWKIYSKNKGLLQ